DFTQADAPVSFIYDASQNYQAAGIPLVVLAGAVVVLVLLRAWGLLAVGGVTSLGVTARWVVLLPVVVLVHALSDYLEIYSPGKTADWLQALGVVVDLGLGLLLLRALAVPAAGTVGPPKAT
ncbi:hypothetical protein ACIQOV_33935, partial [Kitasatospora sp. NPDC091257]|uniref:hypothetical protein n=1 Tax=Kitasatospora sp. NPDC091257 TaxID=3364084 RepID=UPI00382D4CAC